MLSTALAIWTLVTMPAAVESMARPDGAPDDDVVGVVFVDVVGVVFDEAVTVASMAVAVAFKDVTTVLPVCFMPW